MKLICQNQKNNNLKSTYKKGFTLLEIVLALGIASILMVSFYFIFSFSLKSVRINDEKDEIIQNGKYAINYITREIKVSEKIISSRKFNGLNKKYPNNLGFVIQNRVNAGRYKYIFYYHYEDKIRRCVAETEGEEYPMLYEFSGHNEIAEHIVDIKNSNINLSKNIITLNFSLGYKKHRQISLKSTIFLRCPVEY